VENIEKALLQINETLREIRDIKREKLDYEIKNDKRDFNMWKNQQDLLGSMKEGFDDMGDNLSKVTGKDGQIKDKLLEMMGIKEEIEIDGLDNLDGLKEDNELEDK